MALALTLNGTTTTTIPGSPANGDRIAMANGTLRLSFTYNQRAGTSWCCDLIEWSADGGTTWTNILYAKDAPRGAIAGTEMTLTSGSGTLAILTNTASTLSLQQVGTVTVNTVLYTFTINFTMTSSLPNVECTQYLACGAALALTNNTALENFGSCFWSPGNETAVVALFDAIGSSHGPPAKPNLYYGNLASGRLYLDAGNTCRNYGGGMSLLLTSGHLCSFFVSPLAMQSVYLNGKDAGGTYQGTSNDWQMAFRTYLNWFKTSDAQYQSLFDNTVTFIRPGIHFNNKSGGSLNFPQATTTTDATTTLHCTWSLVIEKPTTGGNTGLPIPRYIIPQRLNYWQDQVYPRPNVGGASILGGGSGPMWQPLATLETTVKPILAATYSTYFDTTYGYWETSGTNTHRNVKTSAYALQACLRWLNLGVGNADAQTMADQLAVIIANYQQQSGGNKGAIFKVRHTDTNNFWCQEGNHAANTDQPHVAMYVMAECLLAMIEYYRVRGNQTLAATYGNITVATLLDQAMTYLVTVMQASGGFLVEYNNVNTFANANGDGGYTYPGSVTVDLAASLLHWSQLSPTASAAQKTQWQTQALRAAQYYMLSESVPHGNFEFGENYDTYSHHGTKQLVRGFARLHKLTGGAAYLEHMAWYFEMAMLLCKRVDEVLNSSHTNNQDFHSGGLISTLDWNGVDSGEACSDWAIFMTEAAQLYPGLLPYHYFYMWANLCHMTWGYRDAATSLASDFSSYAFFSPGTNFAATGGLDNTHFLYFAPSAALALIPTRTACACDNSNVFSTCLEANLAADTPAGRTIMLYNPQGTSQVVNLTVRGQANKSVQQDGTAITGTTSGLVDLLVGPLTLTTGQISKIVTR